MAAVQNTAGTIGGPTAGAEGHVRTGAALVTQLKPLGYSPMQVATSWSWTPTLAPEAKVTWIPVTGELPLFNTVMTRVPGDVPVGTTRVAVVGYRFDPDPLERPPIKPVTKA